MKLFNKIAIITASLALCFGAAAQNVSYFYSAEVFATPAANGGGPGAYGNYNGINGTTSTPLVLPGNGATNLVAANYSAAGGWFTTRGVTSLDPNAVGITLQYVVTAYTNTTPTNIVTTIGTVLDTYSRDWKLPLTSGFTVTNSLPAGTNTPYNLTIQVPAASFNGAQWAKVTAISYTGSPITFTSARAGFWY